MSHSQESKRAHLVRVFEERYTCKKYLAGATIPDEDFETILEVGRLSPSSLGFEPWHFLTLDDPALREKLHPHAWGGQKALEGASHYLVILARRGSEVVPGSEYVEHIMTDVKQMPEEVKAAMKAKVGNFMESDFGLADERALFDWACKQCYIALGNMLTAAAWLGIASTPIEGFNREEVEELLEKEGLLDRSKFGVAVMAAFGVSDHEPRPKTRRPMDEVLTRA